MSTICDHGDWRKRVPECVEVPELTDAGSVIVHAVSDTSLAKRRVLKQIEDWSKADELMVVCAYNNEGRGKHWINIDSEESKAWVIEKLQQLLASIEATAISVDETS